MKHFRYIFYLCALSLLISCSCDGSKNYVPKQAPVAALRSDTIPDGAIPFHYFNDTNDTIKADPDRCRFEWQGYHNYGLGYGGRVYLHPFGLSGQHERERLHQYKIR